MASSRLSGTYYHDRLKRDRLAALQLVRVGCLLSKRDIARLRVLKRARGAARAIAGG